MQALPSIAFGGFSGSAKGVTARQVAGRTILSVKAYPTGYATPAQVVRRGALSKISKAYKTLTAEQMRAWEQLAEHATGSSVFGQKAKLSGHNVFVRLNANRAYLGEGMISDAPQYSVDIPSVHFEDIWVTPTAVILTGIEQPQERLKLVVKMSDAVSPGVSVAWGKTVIVAPNMIPDWGEVDVTTLYTETLGLSPVVGLKYFVQMYWIDSETGFTGVPLQIEMVATENTSREGQVMNGPRVKMLETNIAECQAGSVDDYDLELSKGSAYVSLEGRFTASSTKTLGPFKINPVPPVFDGNRGFRFGFLGRPCDLDTDERVILTIFSCEWTPGPYDPAKWYKMTVKLPTQTDLANLQYEINDTSVFVYKNGN